LLPHFVQAINSFNQHQSNGQPEVCKVHPEDVLVTARLMIDGQFARYLEDAKANGKDLSAVTWVADKTPQHTIAIPSLNELYPESKFIHIMRDPRDVAVSGWFHDGTNDPRSFEEFIRHYMNEVWPLQVGSARRDGPPLGSSRFCEVRYGELLKDTHSVAAQLFAFLGVDHSPSTIEACVEAASFRRLSGGRRPGEEDSSSFFRKGVAGDWVNHLPIELAQECCNQVVDLMRSCGYEPDCGAVRDELQIESVLK
jgi:hypothetical protein